MLIFFIMEKNKKEELQSRRDFFKKASKRVLPIIGAIVFSNTIVKAASSAQWKNAGGR